MTGSSIDDFRTIRVSLTDVNQFIPPIITSAGDSHGRRLAVTLSSNGRPVALTNLTANLLYNPQDGTFGDMVSMSKDGDTFYADVPAGALTGKDITRMAVAISDSGHTVVTREFELMIERGALNTAGEDGGAGLLQEALDSARVDAERAETAASSASGSADAAAAQERAARYQAAEAAKSAQQAATAAEQAEASKQSAVTSESNAMNAYQQSINLKDESAKSAQAAKQSEDNAKQSADAAAESAKNAQQAEELVSNMKQVVVDQISNFTVTANAESVQSDVPASVKVTRDGAAYNLAFNIPQGTKGEKGEKGDVETAINSVNAVYDNTGATTPTVSVDAQGTPNARDLVFHFDGLKGANGRDGSRIFVTYPEYVIKNPIVNSGKITYYITFPHLASPDGEKEPKVGDFVLGVGENYITFYIIVGVEDRVAYLAIVYFSQTGDTLLKTATAPNGGKITLTPLNDTMGILTVEDKIPANTGNTYYHLPQQIDHWNIMGLTIGFETGMYRINGAAADNYETIVLTPVNDVISSVIGPHEKDGTIHAVLHVNIRKNQQ